METQSHLEYAKRVGYAVESELRDIDARLSTLAHDLNKIIVAFGT